MLIAAAIVCAAHPAYALKPVTTPITVRRNGPKYQATASLRFIVVPKTPAGAPAAVYHDHLAGHKIIAQRVAQSSIGKYDSTASTPAQARTQVQRAMMQMTADAQKELDREERVYDSVTADGAEQDQAPQYGFPGGADVHDPCPSRTPSPGSHTR